ncbi:MAG TPA: VOC family protein [Usitatibacter sp.]|nr:VOC family protein [Usitatibacter sp.]
MRELDHLVVAARTLDEGAAWVQAKLGVAMAGGGKHGLMSTHNRLLKLDAGRFLEVIAIDPDAAAPGRARWFGLDSSAMQARLAQGPALIHWVDRTDDLEGALADYPEPVEILSLSRGSYRWRMGVPRDGRLPAQGAVPTLIQWDGPNPWPALPDTGVSLLEFNAKGALSAVFATPAGTRTIP